MNSPSESAAAQLSQLHEQNNRRIAEAGGLDTELGRDMQLACLIQEWMFAEIVMGTNPIDLVNRMIFGVTNNLVEATINIANYTGEPQHEVFEKFEDCIHANGMHMLENAATCMSTIPLTKQ